MLLERWHTIGRHGSPWTPEQARKEARRLLGELAAGKHAPAGKERTTISDATESFVEAHCRHLRSGDQIAWLLRKHIISRWGTRKVTSIEHRDVVALLHDVQGDDKAKRIRITNRVRMVLGRFFKWAISEALIPSRENPVTGTEPRRGEAHRERVLTDAEIKAVWGAANDWPYGSIIRLLLATGQRRAEVGGMRWGELDLENRLWRLPKERTKSKRDHLVPLNSLAMEIPTACLRIEGRDGVFSTRRTKGECAVFAGWSAAKYRLDARCNVQGWRLHDLRRTVATGMQAAGVMPHVVAAVVKTSA